jgi:hypothetical protein
LISPWSKNGLLNANVLDLAITVLSRSKNAAVRIGRPVAALSLGASELSAAVSDALTILSIRGAVAAHADEVCELAARATCLHRQPSRSRGGSVGK